MSKYLCTSKASTWWCSAGNAPARGAARRNEGARIWHGSLRRAQASVGSALAALKQGAELCCCLRPRHVRVELHVHCRRQRPILHLHTSAYVSMRRHTSAYASIRQHTPAYASIRQHTSAYVSIRQLKVDVSCRRQRAILHLLATLLRLY